MGLKYTVHVPKTKRYVLVNATLQALAHVKYSPKSIHTHETCRLYKDSPKNFLY